MLLSSITTMVVKPTGSNTYDISFTGGINKSEQAIEAYYVDTMLNGKAKEHVLGKIKIRSYTPITKKLTPVILNGASFSLTVSS